ncbi:His-Xaa-Ser system protein HxsD [uncultured Faecalibaculum sp.]|uniref:His-Xaa-Ser system protein HxsD n=1 Tax=uncultured Faecalibaculum sp. TaxID=1729681 RepID=UPI0026749B05|nr:His-Xaa-Ser system protein HxsD [uncultured Faecalibaculum sp.]
MEKFQFHRDLYSKSALIKTAYNFTDRAYIHLDADETYYYVQIAAKKNVDLISFAEFQNEMLAQSVRHEIYLQTKNIRELLVARTVASSMADIAEVETSSIDEAPTVFSEDLILKDWFSEND